MLSLSWSEFTVSEEGNGTRQRRQQARRTWVKARTTVANSGYYFTWR